METKSMCGNINNMLCEQRSAVISGFSTYYLGRHLARGRWQAGEIYDDNICRERLVES